MTRNKSSDHLKQIDGATSRGRLGGSGNNVVTTSGVEILFGSEDNVGNMADIIPARPWTRAHISFDGLIENRTANTTPRWRVDLAPGGSGDLVQNFAHGAWWCDSHTSYDYGSATHVRGYEIVGTDTMSLGWLVGSNRDLGQGAAFHLELDIAFINGRLALASHWYGMRSTLDYMVHMKGSYTWLLKPSDFTAMDLWFGSNNLFSYTYKAEFHN